MSKQGSDELIVCGADEVFILDMGLRAEKVWSWKADTCRSLPESMRGLFTTTDECKPVDGGRRILITSSSSGIALVERATGEALFWAANPNAHSACLLPGERVAVAVSQNPTGDRLVVYDLGTPEREVFSTDLAHGHGAVWDQDRDLLYALAHQEIRTYRLGRWDSGTPVLEPEYVIELPEEGGHDLMPVPGTPLLQLSTRYHCWHFHRDTNALSPHPDLPDTHYVKCMDTHPVTGQFVYLHGQPGGHWWSDRFLFLRPESEYRVPGAQFYKARWNAAPAAS